MVHSLPTQCNTHASVVTQTCASITCSHVSFASNLWLRACFLVFVSHLSDQVEIAHGFCSASFQQLRRWHHGPSSHHSMHSSCFRTVTSASCFFYLFQQLSLFSGIGVPEMCFSLLFLLSLYHGKLMRAQNRPS